MNTNVHQTAPVPSEGAKTALLNMNKLAFHLQHMWDGAAAGDMARVGYHGGNIKFMIQEALKEPPSPWLPIETAPEDEHILIATIGGHVGTAYWTDEGDGKVWGWGHPQKDGGQHLHPNLTPLAWMPLPKHPEAA